MKYFTLHELTHSATATLHGWPNVAPPAAEANLRHLVEEVLDPLREAYGHPIYVNSGYRSARLNRAVGGVATSQHCQGQAADIHAADNGALAALLQQLHLPFDQLIIYPTFLHVSWSTAPRRQVIRRC